MKVLLCMTTSLFFLSACTTVKKLESNGTNVIFDECQISAQKLNFGQIRYFDGMNLRLPNCPIVEDWKFKRLEPSVARQVWRALDLNPAEPEDDFLYVNIEFLASILPDGTVEINHIEKAELTENSVFD